MVKHSQKALITVLKSYVETRMVTLMQQRYASSLGKTLEGCWKISPGKSIIRRFVKNIATAGIRTVAFYTKFMQEILEFWMKEYGQAKSGSTRVVKNIKN